MPDGIIQCANNWSQGFCWEKITQFVIDITLIAVSLFQLLLHCRQQCIIRRITYLLYVFYIVINQANMFHQLYNFEYALFDLQSFFFNCYFATILYYAGSKLIKQVYSDKKLTLTILRVCYGGLLLIHLALFIASAVIQSDLCLDYWYLAVRLVGFIMAAALCILGRCYEIRARKKLKDIEQISHITSQINNPLPKLWCWVLFNLVGQFINVVKTLVFVINVSLNCTYDKNNYNVNYSIALIIQFLTFYFPFVSTLYLFWIQPCKPNRRQSYFQNSTERTGGIQMTAITNPQRDSF